MNTVNNIFETKEQYVAFRKHWKQLHTEGFHKRKPVPQHFYNAATNEVEIKGYHRWSPLTAFYHMVFNVATGRDPFRAFKEKPDMAGVFTSVGLKLRYGGDFSIFGETINPEQQAKILKVIQELARKV